MSERPDMEAIKRRDASCFDHPLKIFYDKPQRPDADNAHLFGSASERDALLDRRDLIAEVERLTAKIRDLRLWAVSKSATMSTWSNEDWQKFPLASDEYGPYCPVCQAGPGRIHKEHRAGCEWMLLFQGTL